MRLLGLLRLRECDDSSSSGDGSTGGSNSGEAGQSDGVTLLELNCGAEPPMSSLVTVRAAEVGNIPSAMAAKGELV